jgi:hypothetical protein
MPACPALSAWLAMARPGWTVRVPVPVAAALAPVEGPTLAECTAVSVRARLPGPAFAGAVPVRALPEAESPATSEGEAATDHDPAAAMVSPRVAAKAVPERAERARTVAEAGFTVTETVVEAVAPDAFVAVRTTGWLAVAATSALTLDVA